MGVALASVPDDRNGLSTEAVEIRVLIVINVQHEKLLFFFLQDAFGLRRRRSDWLPGDRDAPCSNQLFDAERLQKIDCRLYFIYIPGDLDGVRRGRRSEEHTSELQSQSNLVCRLLLEKKN